MYIGRNEFSYRIIDSYDDEVFYSNIRDWSYAYDFSDSDFVEEVYEVHPDYVGELEWWLECQSMNEYRRNQCACTFDKRTSEEMFAYLVQHSKMVIDRDGSAI